ncbi:Pr6Pr family membrane protein [Nocardioides sp. LHG3406-4]|uniref:Pr6Pr family membrane protein n=1 Tax=Nocardioides sp. LHG3406-4 TaxID=2804575 RepID=UPI003CF60C8F
MSQRPDLTRRLHAAVALLTFVALVYQLWLVVHGTAILAEGAARPELGTRIVRFFSYFTIQANLLVLVTSAAVAWGTDVSRGGWRAVRLSALTGITVTAVVHWFALRPILDLSGGPYVADKLVHVAVPLAAVAAWLLVGPHGLGGWGRVGGALVWPTAWLVYTLVRGGITGWYPYPFLDADDLGAWRTTVNCALVALLLAAVAAALLLADRRLSTAGRPRLTV